MKSVYKAKKRNSWDRKRKRIILIATEGKNKTEETYFRNFQTKDTRIIFARGNFTDPVNMATLLVDDYKDKGLDKELGDIAFCVVDGDVSITREKQILDADNIVKGYGSVIVSNPCIEVWFLCHFTDSTKQYASGKEVIKRLQDYLPEYEKNISNLYELIYDKTSVAVENAKRMETNNNCLERKIHRADFQPSTEVYKIIETIY